MYKGPEYSSKKSEISPDEAIQRLVSLKKELDEKAAGIPKEYYVEDAHRILAEQPDLACQYAVFLERVLEQERNEDCFDGFLRLAKEAPDYCWELFPVFQQAPALLEVYGEFARLIKGLKPKERAQDKPLAPGLRISTTNDSSIILQYLERNQQIESHLRGFILPKEQRGSIIAQPFDGNAAVWVEKIDWSNRQDSGILVAIRPVKGGIDFASVLRKIFQTGIISSEYLQDSYKRKRAEIGYLLKRNYELDEEHFFQSLLAYSSDIEQLNSALENNKPLEKHIIEEGMA